MSLSDNYTDTPPNPDDTPATILSPITQALKDNNITLDRLSSKINDLIDCKRPVSVDKKGNTVDTNDNPSQIKAVDMALKLQQAYPAERHEVVTDTLEDRLRRLRERESVTDGKTEVGEG